MIARIGLVAALALAGCSQNEPTNSAAANEMAADNDMAAGNGAMATASATAQLAGADGTALGNATVTEEGGQLRLTLSGLGMPPGEHGMHVHTVGKCEGPKFESAGGHWNPTGKQHGRDNPQGAHAGDAPNITVAADGTVQANATIPGTMASLLDADGAAVLVHAKADDYRTDPSGDSGDRIACGVFAAG